MNYQLLITCPSLLQIAMEEENTDWLLSQAWASIFQGPPTDTKCPLWQYSWCRYTQNETCKFWVRRKALSTPFTHTVWIWVSQESGADIFRYFSMADFGSATQNALFSQSVNRPEEICFLTAGGSSSDVAKIKSNLIFCIISLSSI